MLAEIVYSLGGISVGGLGGAMIDRYVSHHLEKTRLAERRKSDLEKEIFFKKQNVAEMLLADIFCLEGRLMK